MICNSVSLGSFDHCDPVSIEVLAGAIVLRNIVTKWECSFANGTVIGSLAPGEYITEYNGITYTFVVGTFALLMENGANALHENGEQIILENA